MKNYLHQLSDDTSESTEKNGYQGWRPVMAHPLYVGFGLRKSKCGCGRVFKSREDYEAHYLYHAIWKNESDYLPTTWQKFPPKEDL